MKNNYIYNILIFLLILGLLLLLISNLNLVEGMEIDTSQTNYRNNEAMDSIAGNPGNPDEAYDSPMLDNVQNKPKLMSDTTEKGVREKINQVQTSVTDVVTTAFNSFNEVVPPKTIEARNLAYSILSLDASSDLSRLRTSKHIEYMANKSDQKNYDVPETLPGLNTSNFGTGVKEGDKLNVDRDTVIDDGSVKLTYRNTEPNMFKVIDPEVKKKMLKLDSETINTASKLNSTNKAIVKKNEVKIKTQERITDAKANSEKQQKIAREYTGQFKTS